MKKQFPKTALWLLPLLILGFFLFGGARLPGVQATGEVWTWADGNYSYSSLNYSGYRIAANPFMAVFNNELYVTWSEVNSTNQLRVRKYNGTSWTFVDGSGAYGLNYNVGDPANNQSLIVFNGNLYLIWYEYYNESHGVIHVKRYDGGSTWTLIDGGGANGLNKDSVNAGCPSLGVYDGNLYAAWIETYSGAAGACQVHVKRYDGGTTWSFVDGGDFTGLNIDTNHTTLYPKFCVINNALYLIWTEVNADAKYQVRVKRYDGGSTWTPVDGGSGLNYNSGNTVEQAGLVILNNTLYAYWLENYKIRLKSYNGSAWSTADGNNGFNQYSSNRIFVNTAPKAITYNNKLYFTWGEETNVAPKPIQTRAGKYNGATMTMIDGNSATQGLNYNSAQSNYTPAIVEYNGALYVAWQEFNGNSQVIRLKKTSLPPLITAVTVPADGWYIAGQNLDFTVTFNKAVNVGGIPVLPIILTSGLVNANYVSGYGTATLTFRYTVAPGNADPDGITIGTALSGGSIRDTLSDLNAELNLNNPPNTTGILVDGVRPFITTTTPADGAVGVGVNENLIINFQENIRKGSGNITIKKTVDDSIVETISVASESVLVSGTSATIDPSVNLESDGSGYYVAIDAGAFQDTAGNNFVGISAKTEWNFNSIDTVAPSGYSVNIDPSYINDYNKEALSFTFAGAEVGATYNYTLTSSNGGTPVTGSGTVNSASQQVTWITTLGLNDGTLTLSVTLTDPWLNAGTAAADTVLKDTLTPSGYSVAIDQAYINQSNKTTLSFVISGAETGAFYTYSISSSGGGGVPLDSGGMVISGTAKSVTVDTTVLSDGTLTLSLTMSDAAGNTGSTVTDSVLKDTARPSGYNVYIDQIVINNSNQTNMSFMFDGAEVGAAYNYSLESSGGGTPVTGTGTISIPNQQITGIDTTGLNDGTLTLSVTLTDTAGNTGLPAADTVSKDVIPPSGYSVSIKQNIIRIVNQTALSFTFTGAEAGLTYHYTILSSGGGASVNGTDVTTSVNHTVTGVNVSGLNDGTLTLRAELMDSMGNWGAIVEDTVTKDTAAPTLVSAAWTDNTHLAVTLSENCLNITKTGTGGFAVNQIGNAAITYAVSAIAQGENASQVILTVANMAASGSAGVKVSYTAGTDGTARDAAGNPLVTNSTGVDAPAWDIAAPMLVSAVRTNNTRLTVTLSEDCVNLTNANNGGFTVEETGNPGRTYAVTATAQGSDACHIILTVTNLKKSGREGVTVKYTAGGNGMVADIAGNAMETDSTGVNAAPWDTTPPTISSSTLAAGNTYLDIVFNEGVFGADTGSTPIAADDLALTFAANGGLAIYDGGATYGGIATYGGGATNAVISSVKKNNSTVEASASALTGNETTIRVFLNLTGTPSGVETIEIKPANDSAIYDVAGNAALSSVSTGAKLLYDKLAPAIVSVVRTNNTHITVTLSEDCVNLTQANDGGFTVNQLGSPTINYAVSAITQGASASEVVLTVANMGVSSREGVKVRYAAGTNGTIQDTAGNPMPIPPAGFNISAWDTLAPTITSGTLAATNGYLDITFSEGVYGASNGAGPITVADLALTFAANGGAATNVTVTSVKKNNSTAEGSASALTGGETVVRVFLSVTGTPSGVESIEIKPFDGVSIYDKAGNAVLATETTGAKTLNDKLAPTILGVVRTDDTHLVVTLSEDCINITKANNGGFTVNQLGNAAVVYTVTAIAQGVDAHHVILTVADMGASAAAGIKVKYTAGTNGTIQDLAGNSMTTPPTGFNVPAWV